MNIFSKIILGSVQFGLPYGFGDLKHKSMSKDMVFDILNHAWNMGIRTIDTAFEYGDANEKICSFMKRFPEKKFNIITKIKNIPFEKEDIFIKKNILSQGFRNLKSCKSISVLLHDQKDIYREKVLKSLSKQKKANLIKNWGVSVYDEKILLQVIKIPDCKIVQLPFSVLNQYFLSNGKLSLLIKNNKKIQVRSVFTKGLLFNKKPKNLKISREIIEVQNYLLNRSLVLRKNISQLALSFILYFKEVNEIVVGFDNLEQLKEIHDLNVDDLNRQDIEFLKKKGKKIPKSLVSTEKWYKDMI